MKSHIAFCFSALMVSANAQPVTVYAVGDASAEVTTCRTILNGGAPVDIPVVVDNVRGTAPTFRVCLVDVSTVAEGANTVSMAPYDAIWGVTGASVSLPFTRPSAAAGGVGSIRLSR